MSSKRTKKSTINSVVNHTNTYQLTPENKELEKAIINQIPIMAINNKPSIKSINTTKLTQYKRQNGQFSHIMAQILGPSPNYSAALI
jgi:hypothetical protein